MAKIRSKVSSDCVLFITQSTVDLDPINVLLMLKSSILEGGAQAKSALSASMQMHRAELL